MNEAMKPPRGLFDCHMCGVKCTPVEIEQVWINTVYAPSVKARCMYGISQWQACADLLDVFSTEDRFDEKIGEEI